MDAYYPHLLVGFITVEKNNRNFENLYTNIHASRIPSGTFCYFFFGDMYMETEYPRFPLSASLTLQTSYILNGLVPSEINIQLLCLCMKKHKWEQAKISLASSQYRWIQVQLEKTTYTKSQEYSEKENKKGQACPDNQIWQEATVVSDWRSMWINRMEEKMQK